MKYDVLIYGREELRVKATPVAEVNEDIRKLARDMLETMYASNGLGLAAEQVGRSEAMFIVDVPSSHDTDKQGAPHNPDVTMPLVLINPRITESEGSQVGQEGCLSFPDVFVDVKRAMEVTVEFTNLKGESQTLRVRGLLSRAVQHELDHLNGVLIVDRMSPVQKVAMAGKLRRLKKAS